MLWLFTINPKIRKFRLGISVPVGSILFTRRNRNFARDIYLSRLWKPKTWNSYERCDQYACKRDTGKRDYPLKSSVFQVGQPNKSCPLDSNQNLRKFRINGKQPIWPTHLPTIILRQMAPIKAWKYRLTRTWVRSACRRAFLPSSCNSQHNTNPCSLLSTKRRAPGSLQIFWQTVVATPFIVHVAVIVGRWRLALRS